MARRPGVIPRLGESFEISTGDAAVKLTTRAFVEMNANPKIGRADAFRVSMRALIEKGSAFEAHPASGRPSWWWARARRRGRQDQTQRVGPKISPSGRPLPLGRLSTAAVAQSEGPARKHWRPRAMSEPRNAQGTAEPVPRAGVC